MDGSRSRYLSESQLFSDDIKNGPEYYLRHSYKGRWRYIGGYKIDIINKEGSDEEPW